MKQHCKVLIVDDEMLIRQGIINYIDWEEEGFQIVGQASNGEEALEKIEELQPNIVITDIVMPIMDGIELVKKMKKHYPAIEIIVLSSFENFDYVRATFQHGVADYILKPKLNGDELLQVLHRVVDHNPTLLSNGSNKKTKLSTEEVIKKMLQGQASPADEDRITNLLSASHFCLIEVCLKDKGSSPIDFKAINLKQGAGLSTISILTINQDEMSELFLINMKDATDVAKLEQSVEELAEQRKVVNAEEVWLLSKPFTDIKRIKQVYDESVLPLKQYIFYFPDAVMLTVDRLPERLDSEQNFDLNHFIDVFKARHFKAAIQYLNEFINYMSKQYTRDSFEFKSFLGNVIFNIIVLLDNLRFDTDEMERKKYTYFSEINEAANVKEAITHFDSFVKEVEKLININNVNGESNIQRLLDYIEEHYTEPLRLTEVAEHFHFNPSYLSAYFSTHHHEGFSEYLNRLRINKAMDLLKNSSVSISDISGMVGYSEHSYFTKVFKKMTGMSPSKYRKEYHYHHGKDHRESY